MKIEVESEALDSIKRMAQQLQEERDELLEAISLLMLEVENNPNVMYITKRNAKAIIAKCTAEPKVKE